MQIGVHGSEFVPGEAEHEILALAVVVAVLVAASAAFVSNQSHTVLACVSSCVHADVDGVRSRP